jgi:hypothetical protein
MTIGLFRLYLVSAMTTTAALMAGCGGGGSAQPTGFDVQAAFAAMLGTPATYVMTANFSASQTGSTAVVLSETDTFTPGAPADPRVGDFPGTEIARVAGPLPNPNTIGATVPSTGTETFYFSPSPFRLVAHTSGSTFERFTATAELPTSAQVGEQGQFGLLTLDQSTVATQVTWSVESAETADTAWVCMGFSSRVIPRSLCVRVNMKGALLGERVVNYGPLMGLTVDLRSAGAPG